MSQDFLWHLLLALGLGLLVGFVWQFFWRPKRVSTGPFPHSHFIQTSAGKVHYIQVGEGPDLVLVHGIGASHVCWEKLIKLASPYYRITAVDLIGFGWSDKPIRLKYDLDSQTDRLKELLDLLGIKKTYIVGCSMGGAISLWLANKYPALIQAVAVISPATNKSLVPVNTNFLWPFVHALKNTLPTPTLIRILHARTLARPRDVSAEFIHQHYVPYHKNPDAVVCFWKSHDTLRDPRLPQELKNLLAPTLILYGERDRLVPRQMIQDLTQILPNNELRLHPDGGHHLMVDEPDFVSREIHNFLASLEGKTRL